MGRRVVTSVDPVGGVDEGGDVVDEWTVGGVRLRAAGAGRHGAGDEALRALEAQGTASSSVP